MRKLRTMTRRRLFTILSLVFVLALTTTTALAARPRFSSLVSFSLTTLDGTTAQAAVQGFTADLHGDSSDRAIALVASGQLSDLVDGQKYEVVINAKGKAEIVCRSDDDYHGSSPTTVEVSASGSVNISPPYTSGNTSFTVKVEDLKLDTKHACKSDHSNDHGRSRVTILKVMYSSGDVTLFESKNTHADAIASFALDGHGQNQPLDRVQFSKCKTKDLNVYCKQKGAD